MKYSIIFIAFTILFIIISCNNKKKNYKVKNILLIESLDLDSSILKCSSFSTNKIIKTDYYLVNNNYEDYCIFYDSLGEFESSLFYDSNEKVLYTKNEKNKIILNKERAIDTVSNYMTFFLTNNNFKTLGYLAYNKNWEIIKKWSNYYTLELNTNVLKVNRLIGLKFNFYSNYKFRAICFGSIDKNLNFINSQLVDTIFIGNNIQFNYNFIVINTGINKIRGLILESNDSTFVQNEKNIIEKKPIYINFYVIE